MSERVLVIIPTYNEVQTITDLIEEILGLGEEFHVLVVDDNSPDGTGERVKKLTEKYPKRVFLLSKGQKYGLGPAYISGFNWALLRDFDLIFEMDADFSHSPTDLYHLLSAFNNTDVVVGSRYIKGGEIRNWALQRRVLSQLANFVSKIVTGLEVFDLTSGFVGYKRVVLEKINFDKIELDGYGFQIKMKLLCARSGFKLKEIPIVFTERRQGQSKMHFGIVVEAVQLLLRLGIQRINKR